MRRPVRLLALVVLMAAAVAGCTPVTSAALPMPTPSSAPTTVPPYDRAAFGDGWRSAGPGCDTRDVILRRDLTRVTTRGCDVVTGTLRDPSTGVVTSGSVRTVHIDHRVPLALAWRLGAWRWTPERREDFANDPAELVATSARQNTTKGDSGLDEWLPALDRCGYAQAFDGVADRYGLVDARRDGQVAAACR